LRVVQLRIRYGFGLCCPIRAHEAAHRTAVVPGSEVVIA
jgi:hypothetical protein